MPSSWNEAYRLHFQKLFGKPFDIQVYHSSEKQNKQVPKSAWSWLGSLFTPTTGGPSDGSSLKLATHDWAMPGYRVYASTGLANRLAQAGESEIGEVILFADFPDPDVPRVFIHALFFILHNNIDLDSRFSIGGLDDMKPEFGLRYHKSALYFTRASSELFIAKKIATGTSLMHEANIMVRNGDDFGSIYQAYFISSDEEAFLDDNSPAAFEEKLNAAADRLSLRRRSCV
jgi:hypothetical protein